MIRSYIPTLAEEEMVRLKHLLVREENDITTQDGLVASLIHDIYNYDYFYEFVIEPAVWKMCEQEADDIIERIANVEDKTLQAQLENCFDRDYYLKVINLVPWGKYLGKVTRYVALRYEGLSEEKVQELFSIDKVVTDIVIQVIESGITQHVLYTNNIHKAAEKLREGIIWFDNEAVLHSAAAPPALYAQLTGLVSLYQDREITYADFKKLYGDNVEVMMTDYAEIVKLRNFYFIMVYDRFN